jgi:hypothetical protein
LDRWIARLETTPEGAKPRSAAGQVTAKSRGATDGLLLEPVGLLGAQRAKTREALASIVVCSSSAVFSDAAGGTIALVRSGDRVVHAGTLGVRGPYGLTLDSIRKQGLTDAQARGVEFVAAWFGAPFDALAVNRAVGGRSLSWGFWPLGAGDIARALAVWKERSPVSFVSMLGDYGFDVWAVEGDLAGPSVQLLDPLKGSLWCGDSALDFIARDPRCIALLARAGRHEDARRAQVEVALRQVSPLFRMSVLRDQDRVALGTVATSARASAAMVIASRAVDLTRMAEILGGQSLPPGEDAEAKLLSRVLESLSDAHPAAAMSLRRTLSSPELVA